MFSIFLLALASFCALFIAYRWLLMATLDPSSEHTSTSPSPSWTIRNEPKYPWERFLDDSYFDAQLEGSVLSKPPNFGSQHFSNISLGSMLKSSRRLLLGSNVLDSPGIIGFDKQTKGSYEYYAYKYLFTNLKQYSSSLILYPYPFTFTPNQSKPESVVDFTKGAVFTVKPDLLPFDKDQYDYFSSLLTTTNVTFGKAKALYDINIAVLSVSGYYDDILKELTYESTAYCNLLATYLGKYKECLNGDSYLEFKADIKNHGKTALVMLDGDAIANKDLLFTSDGGLKFQLLVLPDYYLGAHDAITNLLGTKAVNKIKEYIEKGGSVYASGKAGYLLEYWGVLPSGLYKTDLHLVSRDPDMVVRLKGCNDPQNTDYTYNLLCLNIADSDSIINSYTLSAYFMDKDKVSAGDFTVYLDYDGDIATLKKSTEDGVVTDLTSSEQEFLPFSLLTKYGKGKIHLCNGNPLLKGGYNKVFYNHLLLTMTRNVMIDAYVGSKDGKPIPGGEAGIQLDVKVSFINLYDTSQSGVELHLWFPDFLYAVTIPSACQRDYSGDYQPTQIDLTGVNITSHLKCGKDTVDAFEHFELLLNVEIMDFRATQMKYDVLMVAPFVGYTDDETGLRSEYDIGGIRTDAALAAYLAGGAELDPSAFYPIHGRGDYVDHVFGVENKEDTVGTNVDYVAVVPLISPVVDAADQRAVARAARFLHPYYNNRDPQYAFPFKNESGKMTDYIDFKWLNGKGVVLSADWDTSVKIGKVLRDETFPHVDSSSDIIDVKNGNWSTIIDNFNIVLKQIYFNDSDRFFEHGTQRLLAFVDTATEGGAAALYPDGIPESEKNPNNPKVAKKEVVWVRLDIFFYESAEYIFPTNINHTHVISLDRYPASDDPCVSTFGDARSKVMEPGYFANEHPNGLKENEYSNEMLSYCKRQKISPSELEALSNGTAFPVHYLVPVVDDEVQRADDIMYFVANADGTGYLEQYPELRFVYAHKFVANTPAGQGGKLEIILPEGIKFLNEDTVDPIKARLITYSSGLAFYNTTYNKAERTITSYYRSGGHASNVSMPGKVDIVIEELNTKENVYVSVNAYEMKYDMSMPKERFEKYIYRKSQTATMKIDRFYSLPAVEMHSKLNRRNDTSIFPYEYIDHYSRIGVYIQELQKHRTVYGSAESHHVKDPGMQTINPGLAMVSNLGTCSVPFASFVTHGPGLLIPNAPSTSRVEWDDIWGRRWINPLRSLFPDIPPVPSPLIRFSMTTTYELTRTGTTERVLEWNSDEELDIRVQIKLTNPYPKYFDITICKDNEVPYVQEKETTHERLRIFDPPPYIYQTTTAEAPGTSYQINFGSRSVYGLCFDSSGTILRGQTVSDTDRQRISTAYLCAATLDEEKIRQCSQDLADLPTVNKRESGNTSPYWTYSPEVEKYHPINYIKDNMWDLTHVYYEDNPMNKAFPYHLDNGLPGIDYGPPNNPARYKPHNIISFPVWKGFGFQIWYDKNKGVKRFPQYTGWWSDNLQNKDFTLYAGQAYSNDISVDKEPLLKDSDWINARDLQNPKNPIMAKERLKTIHACLFNQHRVKLKVDQPIGAYLANVYQNNIIPIWTELTDQDKRYVNYDCEGVYQYTPTNISQFDTIVRTNDIREPMLFAANLRGEALETINIVMGLKPLPNVKYEGLAKVQDGGIFSYWNPVNGPNSFEVTGSTLNVVEAKRSDLTVECEVFPKSTTTFKSVLYHLITVADPAEILREWKFLTYTNNYGFGDSVTAVYVGGAQATKAILNPGDYTLIKVSFSNNAGFDWNLLFGAVEAVEIGEKPLSANDLLRRRKRTIQLPLKYNFMELSIPDAIKNYVEIKPSDHNLDVSPNYFDFLDINIATIDDGKGARFYYKLKLSQDIPEALRGKVYEIGIKLKEEFFDKLPNHNDPTAKGYHDYNLQIPSIKFGIPYGEGPYKGKIFYTSGYSTDLIVNADLPNYWNVSDARLIQDYMIKDLRTAASDPDNYNSLLSNLWGTLEGSSVPFSMGPSGSNNILSLNLTKAFPTFPKPNGSNPDIASFNVLIRANSSQLPYGSAVMVISKAKVSFKDFTRKSKSAIVPAPVYKTVAVKGAWLKVYYSNKIVVKDEKGDYVEAPDQRLFQDDKGFVVRVQLTAKNVGTDRAFRVNFTTVLAEGVNLIEEMMREGLSYAITQEENDRILEMNTMMTFAPGASYSEIIYLQYGTAQTRRRLLAGMPLTFIKSVKAAIDLTDSVGAVQVSQAIDTPLKFTLVESDRETVALSGNVEISDSRPIVHLLATPTPPKTSTGQNVRFIFYQQVTNVDCVSIPNNESGNCSIFTGDEAVIRTLSSVPTVKSKPIPDTFVGTVNSAKLTYRVESYNEAKLLLATANWVFVYKKDVEEKPEEKKNETQPQNNTEKRNETVGNITEGNVTEKNETNIEEGLYKEGEMLPLWAIIVIPIGAALVIIAAAIIVWKRFRMRVKIHSATTNTMENLEIEKHQPYYDYTFIIISDSHEVQIRDNTNDKHLK
eukprot:TRINITY_DN3300_c0_g1_i1.p1 TRINITY_DN3300_c0_g1~~TRINITY_DN3300_c0_g1_i1.p1  ORF type:complete len:2552 (-),score=197.78 TRINITY_DN3300_c0_g1_i1:2042-9544(-)